MLDVSEVALWQGLSFQCGLSSWKSWLFPPSLGFSAMSCLRLQWHSGALAFLKVFCKAGYNMFLSCQII